MKKREQKPPFKPNGGFFKVLNKSVIYYHSKKWWPFRHLKIKDLSEYLEKRLLDSCGTSGFERPRRNEVTRRLDARPTESEQ
ncbi:hypothetical protein BBI15_16290 [Planococcus plakortidis]|uniref:Uncharacterized protein n=1 Tax=Planococcus plakortidis TaxID=1038856 RepID=A0A1I9W9N6_9BACL|nr:hypothetical protein BBI15_16290 [Planococcus plakortidis]